jgi:hypothetical protein
MMMQVIAEHSCGCLELESARILSALTDDEWYCRLLSLHQELGRRVALYIKELDAGFAMRGMLRPEDQEQPDEERLAGFENAKRALAEQSSTLVPTRETVRKQVARALLKDRTPPAIQVYASWIVLSMCRETDQKTEVRDSGMFRIAHEVCTLLMALSRGDPSDDEVESDVDRYARATNDVVFVQGMMRPLHRRKTPVDEVAHFANAVVDYSTESATSDPDAYVRKMTDESLGVWSAIFSLASVLQKMPESDIRFVKRKRSVCSGSLRGGDGPFLVGAVSV